MFLWASKKRERMKNLWKSKKIFLKILVQYKSKENSHALYASNNRCSYIIVIRIYEFLKLYLLQIYIWRHSRSFLFIKIKILQGYIYLLYLFKYLFMIFIIFTIDWFNYLFIRKLYLLEVMLLDWIIKLKSIIYVLLQIVYFQKFSMPVTWIFYVSFHIPSI